MNINPLSNNQRSFEKAFQKKKPFLTTADKIQDLKKNWGTLYPEQLATRIIDLEKHVSEGPVVKKAVEKFHFQFIFPLALEMRTFARTVGNLAKKMMQRNSIELFQKLNGRQQQEVMRYL